MQVVEGRPLVAGNGWQWAWLIGAGGVGLLLALMPLPLALAGILFPATLLLLLRYPLLGLLLMLLAGPWGALENVVLGPAFLDSGQLTFLLLVALWLAWSVLRRRRLPASAGIVIPATPLNGPLFVFLAIALLSLLGAPSLPAGFKELLKWAEIAAVIWIVVDLGSGGGTSRSYTVLAAVLLAGLSQAAIGIWQFGLRATGPEHFLIPNLLPFGEFYRAYGTFEQPNPFGGFVSWNAALGIGLLLGWAMAWWQQRRLLFSGPVLAWLLFVLLAAAASVLALLMSWSRGAWLGFAAGMAVLLFFWPRRRWQGTLLLLAALLLFLFAWQANLVPAPVAARLSSFTADLRLGDVRGVDINDANFSVIERLAHWQAALSMARANLWLGVGFGNYEPAYAGYALLNWPNPLGHAHNYYLNLLAEIGVVGLAAYFLFWAAVFWQTLRLLDQLDWPQRGIALGLLAAWSALSVHHLLDKLYVNNLYLHLGAMLGILQLLHRRMFNEGSR